MVADPVHQLPAAEVVAPPPVLVEAARVEGHHLRRADPEVVVHVLRRIGIGLLVARAAEIGVARRAAPPRRRLTLPMKPLTTSLGGPAEVCTLRCQEPVCQIRWLSCTALTMAMPSASVCESGFSQKMSFLALAAAMAGIECQWSGVEMETASMSLRPSSSRKSLYALQSLLPYRPLTLLTAAGGAPGPRRRWPPRGSRSRAGTHRGSRRPASRCRSRPA